jgi:DNA-binding transcriptional MerR regulator
MRLPFYFDIFQAIPYSCYKVKDRKHMEHSGKNYTVGALAESTGCKAVTIRYYEKLGLLLKPMRTGAGYRLYTETARARLLFIRRSRQLGFSLDDIRELLTVADQKESSCMAVDTKLAKQLVKVQKKIDDLRALEAEMQRLLRSCQGGNIAECRIIEALYANAR